MIGVLVLAGGEGSRFKGNKLLAKIRDIPVLGWVLNALPSERVIVAGRYAPEIINHFPEEVILYNPRWKEGISTSLKLGIRFFKNADGVLVALGDMPLITRDTVNKILSSFYPSCNAVIPVHKGNGAIQSSSRGSCLIRWKISPETLELKLFSKSSDLCFVECGEEVLIDVDTEADLIEVSRRLS